MGRRPANAGVRIRQALAECRHSRLADFGQGCRCFAADVRVSVVQRRTQNGNRFRAAFAPGIARVREGSHILDAFLKPWSTKVPVWSYPDKD